MKRRYNFILLIALAFLLIPARALASQGTVKVTLLKKAEDAPSMAQKALNPEAKWSAKGNEYLISLEFLPLEFMGSRGYLGEVTMDGQAGRVTSYYKEHDSYNDPVKGTDKRVKGKLYPKTVEFSVDPKTSLYALKFYVPVMGEMGFGEQEARLKINWPESNGAEVRANEEKRAPSPKQSSTPMDLEDGLYSMPVSLWHETEDKRSMGNGALEEKAELVVKDGKGMLFLGTKTLKVSTIQASLSRVFYETDDGFSAAIPYCYDLKPAGETLPRPRIFALPLNEKIDMIRLKVDPKVAPMGDEPLNARLKLDFQSLKKIEADENTLLRRAESGPRKPSFKEAHSYVDKGVVLSVSAGGFTEDVEFYANPLVGVDLQTALRKLNLPAGTKAYRLACRRPIEKIPKDYTGSVQALGKDISPQTSLEVVFPFSGTAAEVYNEKGEKIPSKLEKGALHVETKSLGVFFIKTTGAFSKTAKNGALTIKPPAKAKAIKSAAHAVKPKKVQNTPLPKQKTTDKALASSSGVSEAFGGEGLEEREISGDENATADVSTAGDDTPERNDEMDEAEDFDGESPVEEGVLEEKERPGLIICCFILILAALGGGMYMTRKYYRMYMDELMYEAERKREAR